MCNEHNKNIILLAGAGTGKTYELVQEYILALLGYDGTSIAKSYDEIFVFAFNEKVVKELKYRILNRILELLNCTSLIDDPIFKIAKKLMCKWVSKEKLKRLASYVLDAQIYTFHSFCMSILRKYSFEANIKYNFELFSAVLEEKVLYDVANKTIIEVLDNTDYDMSSFITYFNISDSSRISNLSQILIKFYFEFCEYGILPEHVVIANPHKQYSLDNLIKKIEQCFIDLNISLNSDVKIKLDKSLMYLRNIKYLINNKTKSYEIKLSQAFYNFRCSIGGSWILKKIRKTLIIYSAKLGSFLCDIYTFQDSKCFIRLLSIFFKNINKEKFKLACYGYNDLLVIASRLLKTNLLIRKEIKCKIKKLFIDEFQDINRVQEDLIAMLSEDKSYELRLDINQRAMGVVKLENSILFIVGDPRQSIYGFRGANLNIFKNTLDVFMNSNGNKINGKVRSLLISKRSQGSIISFVNIVSKSIFRLNQYGLSSIFTDNLSSCRVKFEVAGAIWRVKEKAGYDIVELQAIALASQIRKMVAISNNRIKFGDIAILVRKVKTSLPIFRELRKLGINSKIIGGDAFYEQPEIIDIICAMKLIIDPYNELASLVFVRSSFILLSDSDLSYILDSLNNSVFNLFNIVKNLSVCKIKQDVKNRFIKFEKLRKVLKSKLFMCSLGDIIERLVNISSFLFSIIVSENCEVQLSNIKKLKNKYYKITHNSYYDIELLWEVLAKKPREELGLLDNKYNDFVTIMTIHQSKGLEYPIVIIADSFLFQPNNNDLISFDPDIGIAASCRTRPIADCYPKTYTEKKNAPTAIDIIRRYKIERSDAELARLLYVALTRAKDYIYFIDMVQRKSSIGGRLNLCKLIYFVKDRNKITFNKLFPVIELVSHYEKASLSITSNKKYIIWKKVINTYLTDNDIFEQLKIVRDAIRSQVSRKHISVSELVNSKNLIKLYYKSDYVKYNNFINNNSNSIIGILGHRLIAEVCKNLTYEQAANELYVTSILDAALRAFGSIKNKNINILLKKCAFTIMGPLRSMLAKGLSLSFEEPISFCEKNINIYGYVDLVARDGSNVFIVDFKSSEVSMNSYSTKIQLLLYAKFFLKNFNGNVFMSSCMIGSDKDLKWIPVNRVFL